MGPAKASAADYVQRGVGEEARSHFSPLQATDFIERFEGGRGRSGILAQVGLSNASTAVFPTAGRAVTLPAHLALGGLATGGAHNRGIAAGIRESVLDAPTPLTLGEIFCCNGV